MSRREAEEFEERLQRAAHGETVEEEWAPLIETARQVTMLADPPPHQLRPGRQRLLAEAARLRAEKTRPRKQWLPMQGTMRLATALAAVVLVFGMVLGVGQAAAHSLPGEPLYGLKLAAENVRLALTKVPQAEAELSLALAEKRLAEITDLLAQGEPIEESVPQRLEQQLMAALQAALEMEEPARTQALLQLEAMIQQQQRAMTTAMVQLGPQAQIRVQQLLRVMERAHEQVRAGLGEPGGTPPEPPARPNSTCTPPSEATPKSGEPCPTEQQGEGSGSEPTRKPVGPMPTDPPGNQPGPQPSDQPVGPMPTDPPGSQPGPQPSDQPAGPMPTDPPGSSPGPQPTETPVGPAPTDPPGHGPGPQPTETPDNSSGPQPAETPAGPMPTDAPGNGSGSQPTTDPSRSTPTSGPGSGGSGSGTTQP